MELFVLYPAMLACRHLCTGVDADVYADADGGQKCMRAGRGACACAGALARALFQGYFLINYLEQSRIVVHR